MSTQLASVTPGYDNTSDFPTEPAGWGTPGEVRHAEAIGHGVWMAEHVDGLPPSDELIARSQDARADIATAMAATRAARTFDEPEPARCPIHDCIRLDHPVYELCEDDVGHTWFQGDHDATKETNR